MVAKQGSLPTRAAAGRAGLPLLLPIAGLLFLADLYLIFLWVPTEQVMGIVQRLFYIHVPSALVGFIAFGVAALGSILFLVKRAARWDWLAHASAEAGTIFFTVAIATGAVWAKPVWGTWWVWDANGTLTFMLWFMFLGYLIVRSYAPTTERGSRWAAVVAILGALAVPFVYLAADWWGGLHPERVTGPGARGSLESRMSTLLLISLIVHVVLFAALVRERVGQRRSEESLMEVRRHVL